MSETLTADELQALVLRVFLPRAEDRALAVLVDLPDQHTPDTAAWLERRQTAAAWVDALRTAPGFELEADLVFYRNVRHNNADLPEAGYLHPGGELPADVDGLSQLTPTPFTEIFDSHPIVLAPTQFSATAPLKLAARNHRVRAATMPGFGPAMLPALRLDYGEINRRCLVCKELLDRSERATFHFVVDGQRAFDLTLDLRHRQAHASGGLFPDAGSAGNLPSGETYIVPYEGEVEGDPSRSEGWLPVQFDDEVVLFRVEQNRAVAVEGDGPAAREQAELLRTEPAYGNMAELGLGVLSDFGLQPIGELLLDEKLGLHIAFGRSDHFGGQVGAADFSRAEAVVHIDRVYLPSTQPRVKVATVDLHHAGQTTTPLIRDNAYVVSWNKE